MIGLSTDCRKESFGGPLFLYMLGGKSFPFEMNRAFRGGLSVYFLVIYEFC